MGEFVSWMAMLADGPERLGEIGSRSTGRIAVRAHVGGDVVSGRDRDWTIDPLIIMSPA
jgi:hypothetical protein